MLIGSNNTMTYLTPRGLISKLFQFIGRRQTTNYKDQYMYGGVRFFDLKITKSEHNHMVVRNGSFIYDVFSLYEVFDYFNKMGDVTVRITLEEEFNEWLKDGNKEILNRFKEYCNIIETSYENIMFCGGCRSFDNKKIYSFKYEEDNGAPLVINIEDISPIYKFASMLYPKWVKKLNKKYISKFDNMHGFLLLNHI